MTDAGAVSEVQRLFLRHTSLLRGFITGLCPDFDAAEDILHETFLTVTEKAGEFRSGSDFTAWARAIARFKTIEHLREKRCSVPVLGEKTLELLADSAPATEPAALDSRRRALALCLKEVAPRARQVLELRYVDGLRPPEIAARVSWSVEAVNVALSRARRMLRECAGRRLAGGG